MVKTRDRGGLRPVGIARRSRSALMVGTALQAVAVMILASPVEAQPAPNAQPVGGVVVGGSATISQTAAATTINQATQRAAINWRGFDVGANQSVSFQQPNAQAIALNTVTGPNPSQIAGRVSANGQIVLVNQSGVTFYKGAQINTAGLMVSASGTDTNAFMAGGRIVFNQPGSPNARIVNNGNITIKDAGLAGLVAPVVANAGVINAPLGHVVLAGAKTSVVDLYGDKLTSIDVTAAVVQAPGGGEALVTNSGVVRADGGTVRLTARAVDGVVSNLVSAGGKIEAATVGSKAGRITIDAVGGSITLDGYLSATGLAPGTKGGKIGVLASSGVTVGSTAVVNASGAAGGGTIAIGTTLKRAAGGPAVTGAKTSKTVTIQAGATIQANATVKGDGGRVTVLSSDQTAMSGLILAKGGPSGGNGGFVEVSGTLLNLTGAVDVTAAMGQIGTILLDPFNLNVVAAAGNLDGTGAITNNGTILFGAGGTIGTDSVSVGALSGNIQLQAVNNLTVLAPITLGAGQSLTLQAGNSLTVGAAISTQGAISLSAADPTITGFTPAGQLIVNDPVATSAGTVKLSAGTGGISLNSTLGGTIIDLNTTGGGVAGSGGGITATTLQSSNGVKGAVTLTGANTVAAIGGVGFAVTSGGFTLTTVGALAVNGILSTTVGDAVLTSTGGASGISIGASGAVNVPAANLASFQADKFANAGTVTGGTFAYTLNTAGALTIGTAGNSITDLTGIGSGKVRLGSTVTATSIAITGAVDLNVGTTLTTGRPLELDSSGDITQTAALKNVSTLTGTTTGTVTLTGPGNVITSLGSFAAASFTLTDTGALTVNNTANSNIVSGVTLASITTTGLLTVGGTVSAPAVTLAGSGIAITGLVTDGGSGTTSLTGTTGSVVGTAGAVTSGTLSGTAKTAFQLDGSVNQIGTIGNVTGTTGVTILDNTAGTITGKISAPSGNVFLATATNTALTFLAGGSAISGPGGQVGLRTDTLVGLGTTGATGIVSTNAGLIPALGTFELAPASGSAVTLGATVAGTLSLVDLTGINTGFVRIGAVTPPGGAVTTTALTIVVAGTFNAQNSVNTTNLPLELDANGPVIGTIAPLINVATLTGTASSYQLTNPNNTITQFGGGLLLATGSLPANGGKLVDTIALVDSIPVIVAGTINAQQGNVYLEDTVPSTASANTVTFLPAGGTILARAGGTIGIQADRIANLGGAGGVINAGTTGVLELAPFSTVVATPTITLGASTANGLWLSNLVGITAGTLRYGAVTQPGSAAPTTTANGITIAGTFNAFALGGTLDLEANGGIVQAAAAPIINFGTGTLIANTNSAAGGTISLNATANNIGTLGDVTAAFGDVIVGDTVVGLWIPSTSTIYGNNVTISNTGPIIIGGSIGACETATPGSLAITALSGNITIMDPALIGAEGTATLLATVGTLVGAGNINQLGGLLNATDVVITAGGTFAQNGGSIMGLDITAANTGVTISAAGAFSQTVTGALISSNDQLALSATSFATAGNILSVGSGTLTAVGPSGSLTQTSGTIASGNAVGAAGKNLSIVNTVTVTQSGNSTLSATGSLNILSGQFTQIGSIARVAADTPNITLVGGQDPWYGGSVNVKAGGTVVDCFCPGTVSGGGGIGVGGSSPGIPTAPQPQPAAPFPFHIDLTQTVISITHLQQATWVELHSTTGDTSETATGTIIASYLTGTSAGNVLLGDPRNSGSPVNQVTNLGAYAAAGTFTLNNSVPLTAIGTVTVGKGTTLLLSAPTLSVDASATNYVFRDGAAIAADVTVPAAGSLVAPSSIAANVVTPGQIILQTDALSTLPPVAGTVLISANDGLVAITPYTTTTPVSISLGGGAGSGTLGLPGSLLATIDTLGSSAGTDGTETLLLGALGLNGSVTAAGITIGTASFLNSGVPTVARNLVLAATGAVTQAATNSLSVIALAGTAASFQLTGGNAINEIGNAATRTIAAGAFTTTASLAGTALAEGLMATGGTILVNDTASPSQTLSVVGAINAVAGPGTIALFAPAIQIINGTAALTNGTITAAGSLTAGASTVSSNTITPALIQLQADQLNIDLIAGGAGTLVSAPGGLIAITPLNGGRTISVVAGTAASPGLPSQTLTLGLTDLSRVSTLGTVPGLTAPGPLGTQTLSLGRAYVSNTGTATAAATVNASGGTIISVTDNAITAGSIAIGAALDLTNVASTAALYATGTVTEQPSGKSPTGALIVNTVVGTSTTGSLYLNGANVIHTLGNLANQSGLTTAGAIVSTLGTIGNLIAPMGNVLVQNGTDLAVPTQITIEAGPTIGSIGIGGSLIGGNFAEIDVVATGAAPTGNLSIGGTVIAADVFLRAGNGSVAGNVTISGSVAAQDEADLGAGMAYSPATPTSSPVPGFTGVGTFASSIMLPGKIDAGIVGLFAEATISETGHIGAGLLYGYAGLSASLTGTNSVANLGPFITGTGFLMRDAAAMLITGTVSAVTGGVTIGVAPSGVADLAIANLVSASAGTVDLGATGNVFEASYTATPVVVWNGTGMSRLPAGSTVVSQGTVIANTLLSEAGVLPDTEAGGNTPGTIPSATSSLAIDWFGSPNQVVNLGGITSTGDFLLFNAQSLTVAGNVYAGAALQTLTPAVAAYPVIAGEFGTTPATTPAPFAEIDVLNASNGNLTIVNGISVHAGLDGTVAGDITLRTGNDTTAGLIDIGTSIGSTAGVFAAKGGTVSISAGFNPSPSASAAPYFASSGSIASGITLYGTIWGDAPGGTTITPAGTVTLDAASSIDEPGAAAAIGAGTLFGHAGYHANLGEVVAQSASAYATATVASANRIANVGSLQSDTFNDDPLGLLLRDGQTLTVAGPVTDFGTAASRGISIAVVPGTGTNYSAGDLLLQGAISTQATNTLAAVSLQATGKMTQPGGSITTNTLVAQAGIIPNTEATGSAPGTVPTAIQTVSPAAVATLTGTANAIANLGGASATGDFNLTNVPSLTVTGTVVSTTGNVLLTNTGFVNNNGLVLSQQKSATIVSTASFINNPGVTQGQIDAILNAAGSIANGGLVLAVTHNASLIAGTSISDNGSVIANNLATLSAGAGAPALVTNGIDIAGLVSAPTIIATSAGTITEAGTLLATLLTGSAGGSASLTGSGNPTSNRVGTLGLFDSNLTFNLAPGLLLRDGQALMVTGPVTDHATTVASGVTLSVARAGGFNGYGDAGLTIAGPISANAGFGTARLEATGTVSQTSGIVTAGTLVTQAGQIPDTEPAGHVAGAALASLPGSTAPVRLPDANLIQNLTGASAAGILTLTNATDLTISGPVTLSGAFALTETGNLTIASPSSIHAASASITDVGNATIAGAITLSGDFALTDTGNLVIAATSSIGAGSVTMSGNSNATVAGAIASGGTAAITVAGSFGLSGSLSATTSITIADTNAITFGGLLNAPGIVVNNGTTGQFTVTSGARIQTAGAARPKGALSVLQLAGITPSLAGGNGFYLRTGQFTETGALTAIGTTPQLRIDSYGGIQFGAAGLAAPNSWLVMELLGGGKATGAVNVAAMDIYFADQNTGASLSGFVGGLSGNAAAGAAHIVPSTSTAFQINGCPIASINCVLITTEAVPPPRPLADLDIGYDTDPSDKDDLTLPLVSDQRY